MLRFLAMHRRGGACSAAALLALALTAACAGAIEPRQDGQHSGRIALEVLPASYLDTRSAGSFSLHELVQADGSLRLEVGVERAAGLKALYFRLSYDPAQWHPLSAKSTGRLNAQPGSGLLDIAVLNPPGEPGVLYHGQVLAHWPERPGFSGNAVLATVALAPGPAPRRQALDAPVSSASAAVLSYDAITTTFNWLYYCQGDYDQNGEVNISDLTPLGANLGATGPFLASTGLSAIDGDGNGEINVADLTPIGSNFSRRVQGYRLMSSADPADYPATNEGPDGPGAAAFASIDFAASTLGSGERRKFAYVPPVAPGAGDTLWVRPYDGLSVGTPSNTVTGAGGGNTPPVAALSALPLAGPVPLDITFDASGSADADGDPLSYGWDWDADGTADEHTGNTASVHHVFNAAGDVNVTVFVSDGIAQDTASVLVSPGGTPNQPPTASLLADIGLGVAPLTVNFNAGGSTDPDGAIATYEYDFDGDGTFDPSGGTAFESHTYNTAGMYTCELRVTDDRGATDSDVENIQVDPAPSWHVVVPFSAGDDLGTHLSLAEVNGVPCVAGLNSTQGDLYFWVGQDANGSDFFTSAVQVDTSGGVQGHISLAVVGGKPAVAYKRDGNLYFARASNSAGDLLWSEPGPLSLDSSPSDGGDFASLTVVNGNPAIAYQDATNGELRYIRADSADGTSWLNPLVVIDGAGPLNVGRHCDLKVVGGFPMISYQDSSSTTLGLAHCANANGEAGGWQLKFPVTGTLAGSAAFSTALCDVNGYPSIAFSNEDNGRFAYTTPVDAPWSAWLTPQDPAAADLPLANCGGALDIQLFGVYLCVAYWKQGADGVYFVRAMNSFGDAWEPPVLIDDGGDGPGGVTVGNYADLAEINGHPAVVYQNATTHVWNFAIYY